MRPDPPALYRKDVNATPDLYTYLDYRQFLADWFRARKTANPRYSHRLFARRAGQSSPSLLLHVIEGKRNLTPNTVTSFIAAMGLNDEDGAFFTALVQLAQAASPEDRTRAWELVRATRRFREARRIEGASVEYLSAWWHPAIRELATCAGFQRDPAWIASTLRPQITEAQAAESLALLMSLGLLAEGPNGSLVPTDASLVTPHEVAGMAVFNYHTGMIERAREALRDAPHAQRHFCGVTVAVAEDMLPRLKRELDQFQERLLDLCDAYEGPRGRVVQLNLQLVPLSDALPAGADPQ